MKSHALIILGIAAAITSSLLVAAESPPPTGKPITKKGIVIAYAKVSDQRIKRCLPPEAKEITLHKQFNGHYAQYKISEEDFHKFLNLLWKEGKKNSAHQRDQMSGEGEPVDQKELTRVFKPLGWKPLKKAVKYYSPSKASGAMTTYYFDKETGVAFHDTGYW